MEIDPKLRRELTKRFEMESMRREAETTENWRRDLEAIYRKKHESMGSLLIDIKALLDRMNTRVKTLTSMIKEERPEMRYAVVARGILVLFFASNLCAEPRTPQKKEPYLEKKVADLEKEVDGLKREVAFLEMAPVPDRLSLCEGQIPLSNEDVREAFEREFYQFLDNRGLLTILVKRYGKFLNVVSEEMDRTAMPPDLIYLAIAESYLNPRAVSRASAGGLWQFLKETGKREGLFINDDIDERYSVTRSTRSRPRLPEQAARGVRRLVPRDGRLQRGRGADEGRHTEPEHKGFLRDVPARGDRAGMSTASPP